MAHETSKRLDTSTLALTRIEFQSRQTEVLQTYLQEAIASMVTEQFGIADIVS